MKTTCLAFTVGLILLFSSPGRAELITLVDFSGTAGVNLGTLPCGIILASDGNLYGSTSSGGPTGCGTIFRVTPDGHLTSLVQFTGAGGAHPGTCPANGVIQGKDGNFYGTVCAADTSYETVYRMTPDGDITALAVLTSGAQGRMGPVSRLVEARDGNFYGTTMLNGSHGGGEIYRVTPEGKLTILYNFSTGNDASSFYSPFQGLIQATDGNFYGTSWKGGGGANAAGAVFRMTPDGRVTIVARLRGISPDASDGSRAALVQAGDGNFYGVASTLGSHRKGIVFKVTPQGELTTLVEFTGAGPTGTGSNPTAPLVVGPDGALYGSTQDGGTNEMGSLFRVTTDGALTTLASFTNSAGAARGKIPIGALVPAPDGSFYGLTCWGGQYSDGTIYRLKVTPDQLANSIPAPPPEAMPAAQTGNEHISTVINTLHSPDNAYSISMVDKPWLSKEQREDFRHYHVLVLSKGATEIAEVPTWREMTEAFWSSDGRYLAVNNLRSDMGCDEIWVFGLPSGTVLKKPDDATGKKWMHEGLAAIEQHFPETGKEHHNGKGFLFLSATGWDGGLLKFIVNREEVFDDLSGNFDLDAAANPAKFPIIDHSTFSSSPLEK